MRAALATVTDPRWVSVLRHAPHDFYHLPGYADICAAHEGGEPHALIVDHGGATMLLPLLIRPIRGSGYDAASPYGYPGPLVIGTDDPAFAEDALQAGVEMLRSIGVVSLFVRCHPLLDPSPPRRPGVLVDHGDTVVVDLTRSDDELWRQMRKNHRRDITRATRHGFVARIDEGWDNYETFKRVYRATMERRSAAPYYFFDDTYFNGLREALGGAAHLAVVAFGDEIAAAGLFMETDGIVEYHLSGFDDRFAHFRPSKLLLYYSIGWAKSRGNAQMHLGGGVGADDDTVLHFKLGFSPIRRPFRTLRVVVDEQEYARLVAAHDPAADPGDLTGFFPAYRTPRVLPAGRA
jgi:Uncharacterized protein involved in methicillin resistance